MCSQCTSRPHRWSCRSYSQPVNFFIILLNVLSIVIFVVAILYSRMKSFARKSRVARVIYEKMHLVYTKTVSFFEHLNPTRNAKKQESIEDSSEREKKAGTFDREELEPAVVELSEVKVARTPTGGNRGKVTRLSHLVLAEKADASIFDGKEEGVPVPNSRGSLLYEKKDASFNGKSTNSSDGSPPASGGVTN
mmetsp:Transcript_43219/g.112121  ORF Transcript_43219/g.112121 Transcript_43219/m.112121 type:complete len:193 (+) Transcript_43219:4422-5000(+)